MGVSFIPGPSPTENKVACVRLTTIRSLLFCFSLRLRVGLKNGIVLQFASSHCKGVRYFLSSASRTRQDHFYSRCPTLSSIKTIDLGHIWFLIFHPQPNRWEHFRSHDTQVQLVVMTGACAPGCHVTLMVHHPLTPWACISVGESASSTILHSSFGFTLRNTTSVGSLQEEEHPRAGSLLALTTALCVCGVSRKHLVR